MKKGTGTKQPASRPKPLARGLVSRQEAEPTFDELERQLELASRIDQMLEKTTATTPRKTHVFSVSEADGVAVTGCKKGDERSMLQWMFSSLHPVLASRTPEQSPTLSLSALAASMLSIAPRTPVESLLVSQMLACHAMSMDFCARASSASDATMASKLAERGKSFMEVSCRQAETLMKLRGEGSCQKVVVEHVHMAESSQAIIGNSQSMIEQVGGHKAK